MKSLKESILSANKADMSSRFKDLISQGESQLKELNKYWVKIGLNLDGYEWIADEPRISYQRKDHVHGEWPLIICYIPDGDKSFMLTKQHHTRLSAEEYHEYCKKIKKTLKARIVNLKSDPISSYIRM